MVATAAQLSPEPAGEPTRVEAVRAKIKAGAHASPYRLRKQLPEPVFEQIKQTRSFSQFLLRSFEKVRTEWAIVCTVHNSRRSRGNVLLYDFRHLRLQDRTASARQEPAQKSVVFSLRFRRLIPSSLVIDRPSERSTTISPATSFGA
jgi:Transposase DDE domain